MENLTVSLSTAQLLKEAKFPQETVLWWRIRYSISESGEAHEDYGNPNVVQHSVNQNGWYVGKDARRELKPAVVRWYDSEVSEINRQQISAPTAEEILSQLPNQYPDEEYLWLTIKATQYAGKRLWMVDYESDSEYHHAYTGHSLCEAAASNWLGLQEPNK